LCTGPEPPGSKRPGRRRHSAQDESEREESGVAAQSAARRSTQWTNSCAGHLGVPYRTAGLAPTLGVIAQITADDAHRTKQRDKLTIAEVCADLGISRRTFYEWRAKNRAPKCITLPNGSLRIRRSEYQRWLTAHEEAA